MIIKKVNIGIKETKQALEEFVAAGEAIKLGQSPARQFGIYFENIDAFRKALTPKRLELLHIIKEQKPKSIHELSRMSGRNIKNVSQDVGLLIDLGLVTKNKQANESKGIAPIVDYDTIELKIAV